MYLPYIYVKRNLIVETLFSQKRVNDSQNACKWYIKVGRG